MTGNKLRFGIVGCGQIAQESHIPPLLRSKNVSLVAVCDKNADLVKQVAASFKIPGCYIDLGEMLKSEKLDVVNICLPPWMHAATSIEAMESGCHVLVEKPMALTDEECDRMVSTSQRKGVKLGVVHNRLFEPVVIKARTIVNSGGIGTVTGMHIEYSRQRDDYRIIDGTHWCHQMPGGVYSEELPHIIYLAREFLDGVELISLCANKTKGSHSWIVADEIGMILKGKKGIATVSSSCNRPKPEGVLTIFGTKAHLQVDIYNSILVKQDGGSSRSSRAIDNMNQCFQRLASVGLVASEVVLGRHHTGHYMIMNKFVECMLNDASLPVCARDGKEVIFVFEQIVKQIGYKS